jgi:cation diffusion facilitator CzcD-associated flavoprotein CzcO
MVLARKTDFKGQVHDYLQSYADKFDLRKYTRFNTRVERLYYTGPIPGSRKWTLQSHGPTGSKIEQFDFVSVTNGHYSDCYIPRIRGLEYVIPLSGRYDRS